MKKAIIRLSVLIILMVNQTLILYGWDPLPFGEEQIYEAFSTIAVVGATIYNWYKNNNISKEAEIADEYMHDLKDINKDDKK